MNTPIQTSLLITGIGMGLVFCRNYSAVGYDGTGGKKHSGQTQEPQY